MACTCLEEDERLVFHQGRGGSDPCEYFFAMMKNINPNSTLQNSENVHQSVPILSRATSSFSKGKEQCSRSTKRSFWLHATNDEETKDKEAKEEVKVIHVKSSVLNLIVIHVLCVIYFIFLHRILFISRHIISNFICNKISIWDLRCAVKVVVYHLWIYTIQTTIVSSTSPSDPTSSSSSSSPLSLTPSSPLL